MSVTVREKLVALAPSADEALPFDSAVRVISRAPAQVRSVAADYV